MTLQRCKRCQDWQIIDTSCADCYPIQPKPVRYPLDDKGIFHEPKTREMQIREHRKEEGAIGNI